MKFLDKLDPHKLLKSCHQYWRGALIVGAFALAWKALPAADADKPKLSYSVSGTVGVESPKAKP